MRALTTTELDCVIGGVGSCSAADAGNDYGGIRDPGMVGDDAVAFYEAAVQLVSHIIERVANAF